MDVFRFKLNLDAGGFEYYSIQENNLADEESWITRETTQSIFFQGSILRQWKPLKLISLGKEYPTVLRPGDFCRCMGLSHAVISSRARDVLSIIPKDQIEFLPLNTIDGGVLWNMKTLKFFDMNEVLNLDQTEIIRDAQTASKRALGMLGSVRDFRNPIFLPEKLQDVWIFQIREFPAFTVFITDLFVNLIRDNGLTGTSFVKLWPIDHEAIRRAEYEATMRKRARKHQGKKKP